MSANKYLGLLLTACLLLSGAAVAEEHTVGQKNKEFSVDEIVIKVGDVINFKNEDSFFHNVFSLSDLKTFDLGSYPEGEQKSVTFEESGEVEVECAIHPDMTMTIVIEE